MYWELGHLGQESVFSFSFYHRPFDLFELNLCAINHDQPSSDLDTKVPTLQAQAKPCPPHQAARGCRISHPLSSPQSYHGRGWRSQGRMSMTESGSWDWAPSWLTRARIQSRTSSKWQQVAFRTVRIKRFKTKEQSSWSELWNSRRVISAGTVVVEHNEKKQIFR